MESLEVQWIGMNEENSTKQLTEVHGLLLIEIEKEKARNNLHKKKIKFPQRNEQNYYWKKMFVFFEMSFDSDHLSTSTGKIISITGIMVKEIIMVFVLSSIFLSIFYAGR